MNIKGIQKKQQRVCAKLSLEIFNTQYSALAFVKGQSIILCSLILTSNVPVQNLYVLCKELNQEYNILEVFLFYLKILESISLLLKSWTQAFLTTYNLGQEVSCKYYWIYWTHCWQSLICCIKQHMYSLINELKLEGILNALLNKTRFA